MRKPYEQKINQESLTTASRELWNLIVPYLNYLPPEKRDYIRLAFDFMVENHNDQRRKNGDFYIVHPVNAAITLAEMEFDKESITAALLHDIPEDVFDDPKKGIELISTEFGGEVGFLVSGITKLSVIHYLGEKKQQENIRSLFVCMSKDLRVIFIKMADRLHNLRTLKALRTDKAQRIAMESLEIYAPIAERLGVSLLRSQMEQAAFPYAYPVENRQYISLPELDVAKRTKMVEKLIKKTKSILLEAQIPFHKVFGRAKHHYSIFKKLTQENKTLDRIYDLIALRITTTSISDCYQIMALFHDHFEIFPDRTKDYIEQPKDNGYQSIHLTVKDPKLNQVFEFQIRTQRMQEYAEFGVAAHWWYKENMSSEREKESSWLSKKNFRWIQSLIDLDEKKMDEADYMKNVRLNVYADRIFTLTPKNDVIDLPMGSTPVDFAYKIHEDVGSHAIMAKINGKVAKLNEELKTGDVVEIITSKKQRPNEGWLSFVKNISTAKKIRAFLRDIGSG